MAPSLCEGRYRVLNVLGEGGMSTVYAAHDERLGVQRAVKILSPALTHHSSLRKRFEAEAKTTARLRHPHIVTVHDVGTDHGRTFMVLELMTGGSLMARVEALGPLPPRMACEVVISILSALQYAHEKGVVHRDVKPHNILVDADGVPKLTDFGIARLLNSGEGLTRTGAAIGTPAYMAPEQRGNASQVDGRADVFSAGATLYTLLTGREPFDIYAAELQERLFAEIPEILRPVLRKATRYAAEDRYATASAMLTELREAAQGLPPDPEDAPPLGSPLPDRPLPRRAPDTLTPDERSSNTFDDSDVDADEPAPPLNAFPSLSGVERNAGRPGGTDIEHSLNTKADEEPGSLRRSALWLALAAVVAATLTGLALWRFASPEEHGRSSGPIEVPVPTPEVVRSTTDPDPGQVTPGEASGTEPAPTAPTEADPSPGAPQHSASVSSSAGTSQKSTKSGSTGGAATGTGTPGASSTTASATTAATSRPANAKPGTLEVQSKPRADVFLDGAYQGKTRWRGDLAPGVWKVVLESEEDGRHEAELTVISGQEASYCWDFKRGDICGR